MQSTKRRYCRRWGMVLAACCAAMPGWLMAQEGGIELPPGDDGSMVLDPNDPNTTAPPSPGNYQEDYARLVNGGQTVNAYDMGLFGDSISLSTGALEFATTDVSLPGNGKIPVAFGRRRAVDNRGGGHTNADTGTPALSRQLDLGDWDLDVPYLEGIYVRGHGWKANHNLAPSVQRCSGPTSVGEVGPLKETLQGSVFSQRQFWQGIHLHVPGGGAREVLYLPSPLPPRVQTPNDGAVYRYVTSDFWFLGCTGTLKSGEAGEGFVARSPDGLKYTFDWMSTNWAPPVIWPRANGVGVTIHREQVRLYVTQIEDRFGNKVYYDWDSASHGRLKAIRSASAPGASADERRLDITYGGDGRISQVKDNGNVPRTWSYAYDTPSGHLSSVTQPDGSRWTYDFRDFGYGAIAYKDATFGYDIQLSCNWMPKFADGSQVRHITITHPSGATGVFDLDVRRHGRAKIPAICLDAENLHFSKIVARYDVWALTRKAISGPSLPGSQVWTYEYGAKANKTGGLDPLPIGSFQGQVCGSANPCETSKMTQVKAPDGTITRSTFNIDFESGEENKLTEVAVLGANGSVLRSETIGYELAPAAFPAQIGWTPQVDSEDSGSNAAVVPEKSRVIAQDGLKFTRNVSTYDVFAYPMNVTRFSALASGTVIDSVTEESAYDHNTAKWVLGQLKTLKVGSAFQVDNTYDSTQATLTETKRFGKSQWKDMDYWPDGTLKSVTDGNGYKTSYSNYKRGIARSVGYAGGTTQTAEVDNLGAITSITDEVGFRTQYEYEANGRLKKIVYPTASPAWNSRDFSFTQLTATDSATGGVAGQWKQTVTVGQGQNRYSKMTLFDALWRPVLVREEETGKPDTLRFTANGYDHEGRQTFVSYPQSTRTSLSTGTTTAYDGLGRVRSITQSNGGSSLVTTTTYDTGFTKTVKYPRGNSTTTSFKAYDQPNEEWPVRIDARDVAQSGQTGLLLATTQIVRDAYGKPKSIQRSGPTGTTRTRSFVYDGNEVLCKTVDPESGATLQGYDGVGNLAWMIRGSTKTGTTVCDSEPSAVKAAYQYDVRNRLTDVTYNDGTAPLHQTWYDDGALKTTQTGSATWTYGYNSRRLLESESLNVDDQAFGLIMHLYDANGAESMLGYPDGSNVSYQPNALGQPTQVSLSSDASYASGVQYWPNGAIKGFDYGNNVQHSLTQDGRQLPLRSLDQLGTAAVVDLTYAYDANANVSGVTDGAQSGLGNENRTMTYDGLDRLATTSAPNLWGTAVFSYDAQDNLVLSQVGTRNYTHTINATTNRLDTISGSGNTIGYGYDTHGNATQRAGQGFVYDAADRLLQATGKESYAYDGLGRRVRVTQAAGGAKRYQVYAKDGRLLYGMEGASGAKTNYVYLNGSLLARTVTQDTPAAPANLKGAPNPSQDGHYTVSWDASPTATSYRLREKIGTDALETQAYCGTSRSWSPSGVQPQGTYGYRVQACRGDACSPSAVCGRFSAAVTELVISTLCAPTTPTIAPSPSLDGAYTVSWTAPSCGSPTSYRVEEQVNGGGFQVVSSGSPQRSYAASHQSNGSYGYRVSACLGETCSAPSGTATVQVTQPTTPSAPNPLQSTPNPSTTGTFTLSWANVGATSYVVQERIGTVWTDLPPSQPGTSRVFTGRPSGTYLFQVKACTGGCSGPTTTLSQVVSIPPPQTPDTPGGLRATPNASLDGAYTVLWDRVAGATTYKLAEKGATAAWTEYTVGATTSPSYAVTGKADGTWRYKVSACIGSQCGPSSPEYLEIVAHAPQAPQGLTAQWRPVERVIRVSWTASGGTPATTYQLQEKTGSGDWSDVPTAPGATTVDVVHGDGTYRFHVKGCALFGTEVYCGPWSAEATVTVSGSNLPPPPTTPGAPTGPSYCVRYGTSYQVSWGASSGAEQYDLRERSDDDVQEGNHDLTQPASSRERSFVHTRVGHRESSTYEYTVRACAGSGTTRQCSPWAGPLEVCVGVPTALNEVTRQTSYVHTDGLRSTVAETDETGVVTVRTRYEPYGAPTNGEYVQGPGYAGHVMDAATQLVYMQQRYYDPIAGRFLSTDPVGANGANFNRYWYANNNPYRNVDPDGRQSRDFNWISKEAGVTPPPRAEGDWMGPAIGAALGVVVAPAAVYGAAELGIAALANPATTTTAINSIAEIAAGDALGGSSLVPGSVIAGVGLSKQLASEAQTAKVLAGEGEAIAGAGTKTALRDSPRLAAEHGGEAKDWAKVSGGNYVAKDGAKVETHAYQNMNTGQVVEPKTKLRDEGH